MLCLVMMHSMILFKCYYCYFEFHLVLKVEVLVVLVGGELFEAYNEYSDFYLMKFKFRATITIPNLVIPKVI